MNITLFTFLIPFNIASFFFIIFVDAKRGGRRDFSDFTRISDIFIIVLIIVLIVEYSFVVVMLTMTFKSYYIRKSGWSIL